MCICILRFLAMFETFRVFICDIDENVWLVVGSLVFFSDVLCLFSWSGWSLPLPWSCTGWDARWGQVVCLWVCTCETWHQQSCNVEMQDCNLKNLETLLLEPLKTMKSCPIKTMKTCLSHCETSATRQSLRKLRREAEPQQVLRPSHCRSAASKISKRCVWNP